MTYIKVKNWTQYQHYKQRNPPWVKLHRSILQSRSFIMLDDASKLLAFVCILLAGDTDNQIPNDLAFIKARANLQKTPDLQPLIDSQFIEVEEDTKSASNSLASASKTLASASNLHQKCSSETETETETETEKAVCARFVKPTVSQVIQYCCERHNEVDVDRWFNHYEANGWRVGKNPMKDWKAAIRTWEINGIERKNGHGRGQSNFVSASERRNENNKAAIMEGISRYARKRAEADGRERQGQLNPGDDNGVDGGVFEVFSGKPV